MNKTQEEAWISLFLVAPAVVICGALAIGLAYVQALPLAFLLIQFAAFNVFLGFLGFTPFITNKILKKRKRIIFDERDKIINKRAAFVSFGVVWLYFVIACITVWWMFGPQGSVSVNLLPAILISGLIVIIIVRSVAVLVQYGRGGKGEKNHE
ncbi:hypothetical protein ACFL1G_10670 [Planctomycetota bacterium]